MPRVSKKVADKVDELKVKPEVKSKPNPKAIESNVPKDFDPLKEYTIVSTGASKHMKAGSEYNLDGISAMNLVVKGYANFK